MEVYDENNLHYVQFRNSVFNYDESAYSAVHSECTHSICTSKFGCVKAVNLRPVLH